MDGLYCRYYLSHVFTLSNNFVNVAWRYIGIMKAWQTYLGPRSQWFAVLNRFLSTSEKVSWKRSKWWTETWLVILLSKGIAIEIMKVKLENFLYVFLERHVTLNVDRGIDWDVAVKLFQEHGSNNLDGFYCSKREQRGQRLFLLAILKESSTHLFNITR